MGGKIVIVLFGVFVLGLIIYAVHVNLLGQLSSPFGSLSHGSLSDLFVSASSSLSSGSATTTYIAPAPTPASLGGAGSVSNGQTAESATSAIPASEIPSGFTLAGLSPYFKKITINSAWSGSGAAYGEIAISSYDSDASDTVDITGWRIKTNQSGEYIPQAIALYDPSGLTNPSDIFLGPDQYVYLYSSSGSFNLRLNECIGYVGDSNKFTPALPANCPYVDPSAISKLSFTGGCENYIYSLGSCQLPDLNSALVPQNDYACRDYLENNFNYKGCFDAHRGDANFLSNQWWVWMGSSPLDRYHDTIDLFDKNGLLVDQYTY
jgi:hypothetical protein